MPALTLFNKTALSVINVRFLRVSAQSLQTVNLLVCASLQCILKIEAIDPSDLCTNHLDACGAQEAVMDSE